MHTISWISSSQQLNELCLQWQQKDFIALDTEFIREKTFYPIAGLLQVSVGDGAFLLDPLSIGDWSGFARVLESPTVIKLVHACGEDLEVLQDLTGALPEPLYDTQLAAALLDLGFSWSYARLVKHFLDVEVSKDVTRSDWLQRPLTEQQQSYAAQDVTWLAQLYPLLNARLSEKKRQWLLQDGQALVQAQRNPPALENIWQTIKQAWRLNSQQTAVLQHLAQWRESQAQKRDVPRNRVVQEKSLLELAVLQPQRTGQLHEVADLHPQAIRRDGDALLDCIRRARALPQEQWPQPMPQPLCVEAGRLVKELRKSIREVAEQQNMAAELLLRKRVLEDLVRTGYPNGPYQLPDSLQGWRRELLGDMLMAVLRQDK